MRVSLLKRAKTISCLLRVDNFKLFHDTRVSLPSAKFAMVYRPKPSVIVYRTGKSLGDPVLVSIFLSDSSMGKKVLSKY